MIKFLSRNRSMREVRRNSEATARAGKQNSIATYLLLNNDYKNPIYAVIAKTEMQQKKIASEYGLDTSL
jgi:hypothetical protein